MKRAVFSILLQLATITCFSQSLSYSQVLNLYNLWETVRGSEYKPITSKLSSIHTNWKIQSTEPIIEDQTKYFLWTAQVPSREVEHVVCYVEEDETTIQYAFRYIFFSKRRFDDFEKMMKASEERVTRSTNNVTRVTNYFSPGKSRTILLSESQEDGQFVYTLDVSSKYLPKTKK